MIFYIKRLIRIRFHIARIHCLESSDHSPPAYVYQAEQGVLFERWRPNITLSKDSTIQPNRMHASLLCESDLM